MFLLKIYLADITVQDSGAEEDTQKLRGGIIYQAKVKFRGIHAPILGSVSLYPENRILSFLC